MLGISRALCGVYHLNSCTYGRNCKNYGGSQNNRHDLDESG